MPLLQYFRWVGSFLFAALFAANWCCFAPIARAPLSDVPLDQKVHIRIHTDHKWPERVVLDTTRSTLVQDAKAGGETDVRGNENPVLTERHRFDVFAEMTPPAKPCFRPPCSAQAAEREPSLIENGAPVQNRARLSMTTRKGLTFPNPLHKPPGRS
jgi:hypothetical protein